jgi:hypothetical protein
VTVKHFHHMLEGRRFIVFTEHKPISWTFWQKRDKCSPRQFNHLDFIAQFTTDIRHIFGQDNVVADALSHLESVTVPPSYVSLAASQDSDYELQTLRQSNTPWRLEKLPIPGTTVSICWGTSAESPRQYIPAPIRFRVFQFVHGLSHPGTKTTAKYVAQRFIWPGLLVLPALQSRTLHSRSIGRIYIAGSPFSGRPHRPRGTPSDVGGLHILPHCSRPFHSLARSHHSRHSGMRLAVRMSIPFRLPGGPASRRKRRKRKSHIWDSKIWSRVPKDPEPRKTALARACGIYKRQTRPLVRDGASQKQDRNCETVINIWGSTPRLTDWLTDLQ